MTRSRFLAANFLLSLRISGLKARNRPHGSSSRTIDIRQANRAACTRCSANTLLALDSRFSTWLLRPYLDLADFNGGPLHAQNLEACWRSFIEPASPPFIPQRALSPGFRIQLARE